jgi:hypothetical protein
VTNSKAEATFHGDLPGLIEQYRANVDVVLPEDKTEWWLTNYKYVARLQGWVSTEDPYLQGKQGTPNGLFEAPDASLPDFSNTEFVVAPGDGEPACRCYRCGTLLVATTVLMDTTIGHPRPICQPCKEIDA